MTAGLPDQGFEDSDNSSIFSSPSPKSRQRATAPCSAEVAQNSSVQLRQQAAADEDSSLAVMGVHRQVSHVPVGARNVSSAAELARPRSFILSFPDETCAGEIANSNSQQVLDCIIECVCLHVFKHDVIVIVLIVWYFYM